MYMYICVCIWLLSFRCARVLTSKVTVTSLPAGSVFLLYNVLGIRLISCFGFGV